MAASLVASALPIYYNPDVHNFYLKQKSEFHFQQKSDNEFLMFLLDTAVRVISIVQHLAPVIEAVSDASAEELDEEMSPAAPTNPTQTSGTATIMELDAQPSALSAELEQITGEITNAQISTYQPPSTSQPQASYQQPTYVAQSSQQQQQQQQQQHFDTTPRQPPDAPEPESTFVSAPPEKQPKPQQQTLAAVPPAKIPVSQQRSPGQASENTLTSIPMVVQPIAEAPESIKSEAPVPEVVEIKEEEGAGEGAASQDLLSHDTIQQLMSSISGTDDNVGVQNFIPTATPSSLPPSFLDRGANNPLSMLGSFNSGGDSGGPSDLSTDNVLKNLNDSGLNISNLKGQANPSNEDFYSSLAFSLIASTAEQINSLPMSSQGNLQISADEEDGRICKICGKAFTKKCDRNRHVRQVHLRIKPYKCKHCQTAFSRREQLKCHLVKVHREPSPAEETGRRRRGPSSAIDIQLPYPNPVTVSAPYAPAVASSAYPAPTTVKAEGTAAE